MHSAHDLLREALRQHGAAHRARAEMMHAQRVAITFVRGEDGTYRDPRAA